MNNFENDDIFKEVFQNVFNEVNKDTFKIIKDRNNPTQLRKLIETKGCWNTGNIIHSSKSNTDWNDRNKNNGKICMSYSIGWSSLIYDFLKTFIETKEDSKMTLGNSKRSKKTTESDVWTIENTDKEFLGNKLYHFSITRGKGNEDYNCNFMLNERSLKYITAIIMENFLQEQSDKELNDIFVKTNKIDNSFKKKSVVPNPLIPERKLRDFSEFYYSPDLHQYLTESSNFCKWIVDNKKTECVNMTVVPRYFADKFRINEEDTIKKLNQLRDEYLSRIN